MKNTFLPYVENAIAWARDKLGSEEYVGRCLAFVEDAYEKSNGVSLVPVPIVWSGTELNSFRKTYP